MSVVVEICFLFLLWFRIRVPFDDLIEVTKLSLPIDVVFPLSFFHEYFLFKSNLVFHFRDFTLGDDLVRFKKLHSI